MNFINQINFTNNKINKSFVNNKFNIKILVILLILGFN